MIPKLVWPVGSMEVAAPVYAASIALALANQLSEQTITVTGAVALSAVTDLEVDPGAILSLIIVSDATPRTITPDGTTVKGPAIVTVASKTHVAHYIFGSDRTWKQMGAVVQIN